MEISALPPDSAVAAARDLVYQSAVSHALDGDLNSGHLWTLTVPTGAAKTLAAIGWRDAAKSRVQAGMPRRSIVYALPFTSIIDQNAAVLCKLWDCETVDESMLSVHHHLAEPGDIAKSGEESLANIWVEGCAPRHMHNPRAGGKRIISRDMCRCAGLTSLRALFLSWTRSRLFAPNCGRFCGPQSSR